MIQREILEILACPKCKDRVVVDSSTTWLRCDRCELKFPVRDDFPILLLEEAVPGPNSG
ncbi:MAG: Trm112 family protein [Candidatus Latescibacterota bacterium]|nr:MAG: Trm112 family protein [Candidatus Latescibacterota bacterium]